MRIISVANWQSIPCKPSERWERTLNLESYLKISLEDRSDLLEAFQAFNWDLYIINPGERFNPVVLQGGKILTNGNKLGNLKLVG